ncbi:MAG: RNA-binding S4 domain-containing protein [Rubripirellula sp.]|jgi:ribosome-associated protein
MNKQPDKSVIRLDDFIKRSGMVGTGGEAKMYIQAGDVTVNGSVETRRRKQLALGDKIGLLGEVLTVTPFED